MRVHSHGIQAYKAYKHTVQLHHDLHVHNERVLTYKEFIIFRLVQEIEGQGVQSKSMAVIMYWKGELQTKCVHASVFETCTNKM